MLVLGTAQAQQGPMLIRDAEMERIIRSYANPLLRAAGLSPDRVPIRVLSDPSLNAFVTTGNRMYIHTGLLLRTETPDQLIGVIAHETGHVAGGHLARLGEEIEQASMSMMASMALGILAGMASGRGDVGMAAMSFGQEMTARRFFAFSRAQESAADQFALRVLDQTGQSATGMLEFFTILSGQELLVSDRQDPYVRTHPLTQDRIAAVRSHVEGSAHTPSVASADARYHHARMLAKVYAFLNTQARTLQRYPESDTSEPARYARAVAYFRRGDLGTALPLIDGLLADHPNDPFYHELRGQMLFENQRPQEARASYERALALAPDEPLIAISLAHVLVESGQSPTEMEQAEVIVKRALEKEQENPFGWHVLGLSYGKRGMEAQASYALSEYALLTGDFRQSIFHADRALQSLSQGDSLWLRLQDIRSEAQYRLDQSQRQSR